MKIMLLALLCLKIDLEARSQPPPAWCTGSLSEECSTTDAGAVKIHEISFSWRSIFWDKHKIGWRRAFVDDAEMVPAS